MKEDAPKWKAAIRSELQSLKKTNTYEIVDTPRGRKVIRSKWVLRKKFNTEGLLDRLKARIVIKGFEQVYGIDYFSTFASVVRYSTLRILLAKAAREDLEVDQMDVETAFLNPKLEEEIYMEIPEFFELLYPGIDFTRKCLKLLKSLYGLKQAPRAWFIEVSDYFRTEGFEPSNADPNLFIGRGVFILLFVDDMIIIGSRTEVNQAKEHIKKRWNCKDLGEARLFVGFQIERDRVARSLFIHHKLYATKLVERFKLDKSNPTVLPIPAGTVLKLRREYGLTDDPTDGLTDGLTDDLQPLIDTETHIYRQIVGSLIYLSNGTRLDLCYPVGQLARHMAQPLVLHLRLAKQTLRYLRGTSELGIYYGRKGELYEWTENRNGPKESLYTLFSDATWGTEGDRVSFQGWVTLRAGGAVSWISQRQKSTAQSSMEAEFIAANEAAKEVAWLEKVSSDLQESYEPPELYIDNAGAIDLIHDHKFYSKAKHIDIRFNYIRNDMVHRNRLKVAFISGENQPADLLTKQLPIDRFRQHLHTIGIRRGLHDEGQGYSCTTTR